VSSSLIARAEKVEILLVPDDKSVLHTIEKSQRRVRRCVIDDDYFIRNGGSLTEKAS
jgi:hypothetical protein